MTVSDFLGITWGAVEGPLIEPPRFSPVIADPSFLFPEETPDGAWELFAHSAWGIHRYSSGDGLAWRDRGIAVRNAMRPFVRKIPEAERGGRAGAVNPTGATDPTGAAGSSSYFLFFESYPPLALPLSVLPLKRKWRSKIALSRSADLRAWSRPAAALEAELPWMRDPVLGDSVSNPCLVGDGHGGWRLYHSASLAWIDDCGFCEPRYIGVARGASPEGPFSVEVGPVVDPEDDLMPGVLGAGSMKVLGFSDGWIGLQNKIYRDGDGRSRSAIFLLRSEDGLVWRPARAAPLLEPAPGWTDSHVYACDCRFREADGLWYLYFNARDGWRVRDGRERIGRIAGRPASGA